MLILSTLILFLCSSCHTTRYIPMPSSHTRDSTHLSVYTRADSIREYVSDSMSIRFAKGVVPASQRGPREVQRVGCPQRGPREVQRVGCPQRYTVPSGRYTSEVSSAGGNGIPDTVYIDRWHTAYRDRWHTLNHTDTIRITRHDSIPYPVEVPVEVVKPISKFYRFAAWFTIFTIFTILCIILYVFLRIYFRR